MRLSHRLQNLMVQRLESGLRRASLINTSDWAMRYRVMGKPFPGKWSFDHHPWTIDMHNSKAPLNIGQKAAQMAFTELLLNWSLCKIDLERESVLYVLPTSTIATQFTMTRFDPALEMSPHLAKLFNDVKNSSLKRAGSAVLYIRGSRTRSQLISVPVAAVAVDELEECDLDNIPAVEERMSGQTSKQSWYISTPLATEIGINKYFLESSQEHYFFKCPHCGQYDELIYPDNLIITAENINDEAGLAQSHYICKRCKGTLRHEDKAQWVNKDNCLWVPAEPTVKDTRGFHINQMYSFTVSPKELAKAAIRSTYDTAAEQEFYNQKLGVPRIVKGGKIEDSDLEACAGNQMNGSGSRTTTRAFTMGIDVGRVLHYHVDEWIAKEQRDMDINLSYLCRTREAGSCNTFDELNIIMLKWAVNYAVIDANPEPRSSMTFCKKYHGMSAMCYYTDGLCGRDLTSQETDGALAVKVDRTAWLDLSLGRYFSREISLPVGLPHEYSAHLKRIVKVYKRTDEGGIVARYVTAGKDDHFAHARNYSEIAFKLFMIGGSYR